MWNGYKRPLGWAAAYVGVIIVFAIIYLFVNDRWGGCEPMNGFVDSFYFSVVTITTLGFGDTYPVSGSHVRILVSIEAILGILILGFFLNDIALSQSKLLDKRNKEKEDEEKAENALNKLMIYRQILKPVFDRYLLGIYMLITPFKDRINFTIPEGVINHVFNFQFNNMSDLYSQTFFMSSDFYEPAINAHFRNQDILFNELRSFITSVDLGYWPELEERIYHFILLHHQFQFQDVIINNGKRTDNGKKLKDDIRKAIAYYDGDLNSSSGDFLSPYVALYNYIQDNAVNIQHIYKLMEKAVKEPHKNK